jgi:antitoxin component YwqK of YwqJK toxin-antitoxin module
MKFFKVLILSGIILFTINLNSQIKISDDFILNNRNFNPNDGTILAPNSNISDDVGINIYDIKSGQLISNFGFGVYHLVEEGYSTPIFATVFYSNDFSKIIALDANGMSGKKRVDVYDSKTYKKLNSIRIHGKDGSPPYGDLNGVSNINNDVFTIKYGGSGDLYKIDIKDNTCTPFVRTSIDTSMDAPSVDSYIFQFSDNEILVADGIQYGSKGIKLNKINFNNQSEESFTTKLFSHKGFGCKIVKTNSKLYFASNSKSITVFDNNGNILDECPENDVHVFDIKDDKLYAIPRPYSAVFLFDLNNLSELQITKSYYEQVKVRTDKAFIYGDRQMIIMDAHKMIRLLELPSNSKSITLSHDKETGQKQEKLFYDARWNHCVQSKAVYYRIIITDTDENVIGKVKDYNINGSLLWDGYLSRFDRNNNKGDVHEGLCTSYNIDGSKIRTSMMVAGRIEGESLDYYENGQLKLKSSISNGKKNGKLVYYRENGQIIKEQEFIKGERNGKWVWYHENGKKWAEKEYDNGRELDYTTYNKDGSVKDTKYGNLDLFGTKEKTKKYASDGQRCRRCNTGVYSNGSCDVCGTVSYDKYKEVVNKLPKCDLCKGTGREMSAQGNKSRSCPMCQGKGYRTY